MAAQPHRGWLALVLAGADGWRSWRTCGPWLAGRCFGLSRSAAGRAAVCAGPAARRSRSLVLLCFSAPAAPCYPLLPHSSFAAACTSPHLLQLMHPAPTSLRPRGGVNNSQTSGAHHSRRWMLLGLELAAVYTITAGKSALNLGRSNSKPGWSNQQHTAAQAVF